MVNIVNTLLCLFILLLGVWGYNKKKDKLLFSIAVAFGIFGISHVMALLGFMKSAQGLIVAVRVLAYVIVTIAIYQAAK